MRRLLQQAQVLVYGDVLCPWSWLADLRISALLRELGPAVRVVRRPYPLRPVESLPGAAEVRRAVRDIGRARREREALPLCAELWTSADPPRSSVEPLVALEAARLQGEPARAALQESLRRSALVDGINVTRRDVVYELAARAGLQMNRFAAAFGSAQTQRLIREEHRLARSRGVLRVPAVVIAGRWMISGLREVDEYRELLVACLGTLERTRVPLGDRRVH